jgi:hypothetical protein
MVVLHALRSLLLGGGVSDEFLGADFFVGATEPLSHGFQKKKVVGRIGLEPITN